MPVKSGLDVARELADALPRRVRHRLRRIRGRGVRRRRGRLRAEAADRRSASPRWSRGSRRASRRRRSISPALLARLAARDGRRAAPLKWIRASLGRRRCGSSPSTTSSISRPRTSTRKVVTADGEALISKPIKELFDELDQEAFWQIHRGTIVNLRAIARVERDWRDQPVIVLKGRDEKLTVSRTFAHRFKAM